GVEVEGVQGGGMGDRGREGGSLDELVRGPLSRSDFLYAFGWMGGGPGPFDWKGTAPADCPHPRPAIVAGQLLSRRIDVLAASVDVRQRGGGECGEQRDVGE